MLQSIAYLECSKKPSVAICLTKIILHLDNARPLPAQAIRWEGEMGKNDVQNRAEPMVSPGRV